MAAKQKAAAKKPVARKKAPAKKPATRRKAAAKKPAARKKAPATKEAPVKGKKAIQVAERSRQMMMMKLAGSTTAAIAAEHGVAERTVRERLAEYRRSSGKLVDQDPGQIVEEHIETFQALRTLLAEKLPQAESVSAFVGVVRAITSIMADEVALRQAAGYFPNNLGDLRVKLDLDFLVDTIAKVLTDNEVPEQVWLDLRAALTEAGVQPVGDPAMN